MNPINPVIYITFQGELFPDAEQQLRQRFETSPLAGLGFRLHFSPCCFQRSTIDLKKIGSNCRLSTLFIALLKEGKPTADYSEAQRVELASALSEPGVEPILCTPAGAEMPPELKRIVNQYAHQPVMLQEQGVAEVISLLESALLNEADNRVDGDAGLAYAGMPLHQQMRAENSPELNQVLLAVTDPQVAVIPGQHSDLQTNRAWALQNLVAENYSGAETNLRRCLKLFDADLMANFWLCRLLQRNAKKDSEFQELLRRSELLQRLTAMHEVEPALAVELMQMQAHAHTGLREPAKALATLEKAATMHPSAALWEALVLAGLQFLAQLEQPLQRKDPTLLRCKHALVRLSGYGLEALQAALTRLQRQVPRDKLELILLGVRHDLVAQLKTIRQHEHALLTTATDWELIVPGQSAQLEQSTVLAKSLWSQVKIAQESGKQQLALLQVLATDMMKHCQKVENLQQQKARHEAQSRELELWLESAQKSHSALTARVTSQRLLSISVFIISIITLSGFWWLPLNNTANAAIFGGCVILATIFAHGWQLANSQLKQLQDECVERDGQHQLDDDELPEPRTFNGWFDRLAIRREKLDNAAMRLASQIEKRSLQLQARSSEYLILVGRFEELLFNSYPGLLHSWDRHGELSVAEVDASESPLPEILTGIGNETFKAGKLGLIAGQGADRRSAPYFTIKAEPERLKRLHPIQRKAANMIERAIAAN